MKNKFIGINLTFILPYLICLALLNCTSSAESSHKKHQLNSLKLKKNFDDRLNAFVDISHHNMNVNLETAKNKGGLVGFFHKATQGVNFVDDKYGERIQQGRKLNLLMGAYHFGTGQPVQQQVDAFLSVVEKYGKENIVPILDWEVNPVAKEGTMSKEQATEFINLFFKKTGVYPMIYGGYWMLFQLADEKNTEAFSKTPLWQAFYSSAFGYLDGIWKDWSFIQYTDGHLGPEPHQMTGIGPVDRNFFNGSADDAKAFWNKNALK